MIFVQTIRIESRAPCKNEVKRRLPVKALRWESETESETMYGVRKSLYKVWDLCSTGNTDERKEVETVVGNSW